MPPTLVLRLLLAIGPSCMQSPPGGKVPGGTLEVAAVVSKARTLTACPRPPQPPAAGSVPRRPMASGETPRLRLERAGEENQLRHRHLRLRLVPRQTDQRMRDGLVTERE